MNLHSKHLKTLQTLFAKHPTIAQALLFGSRALGTHKESSDIDIALKGDITPTLLAHLKEELEDSTLPYFCDILDYERAPQELREHIDTHALTLYKREEGWQEVRLGDVATRITSGGTPPTTDEKNYNGEIPWLNTKEVKNCRIYKTEKTISDLGLKNSSAKWIEKDSVIVAMYGATAGKVAINKIPLTTNQACCNITINPFKADYRFVYYSLLNQYERLTALASGAAQQNLNVSTISNLTIPLPPLERQKEIAEILSSFDDKIDFLHRQNRTLESLTTMFYEVLTKDKENSSLLSDIVQIQGGYAFKSKDFLKYGTNRVIKIKNIFNSVVDIVNTDFITNSIVDAINKKFQILSGDILIAMTGAEVGKVGITPKNSKNLFLNQRVGVIREKFDNAKYLAYLHLKSSFGFDYIVNTASGSAQANISSKQIEQCPFPHFSQEEIECFSKKVTPFFEKIIANLARIQNLIKIRNLLLTFFLNKDFFEKYNKCDSL